jgi:hypothetical protein
MKLRSPKLGQRIRNLQRRAQELRCRMFLLLPFTSLMRYRTVLMEYLYDSLEIRTNQYSNAPIQCVNAPIWWKSEQIDETLQ